MDRPDRALPHLATKEPPRLDLGLVATPPLATQPLSSTRPTVGGRPNTTRRIASPPTSSENGRRSAPRRPGKDARRPCPADLRPATRPSGQQAARKFEKTWANEPVTHTQKIRRDDSAGARLRAREQHQPSRTASERARLLHAWRSHANAAAGSVQTRQAGVGVSSPASLESARGPWLLVVVKLDSDAGGLASDSARRLD